MGVALLAWGRFFGPHGERVTVPAPVDGRGAPWLLDFLATASVLSALPPAARSTTGEHHIRVAGRRLPELGAAFSIDVTYLAPQIV